MKKRILITVLLAATASSFAAQTPITQITGTTSSVGALKDATNARLSAAQANDTDLYTNKQNRVTGTCSGQAIQSVAVDGTVTCTDGSSLPISTATQTALNGKANASAFASQTAFTSAWGWSPGGGSFDQTGNYTLTGSWDFSGATVTGVSGGSMVYPGAGNIGYTTTGSSWGTLGLVTSVGVTGSDSNVPTEQAVREAIAAIAAIAGTDDQTAAEVSATPWGSYTGTNVQALMQEVDTALRALIGGAALPAWLPSVGPTKGRQILQATGGCTLSAYDNQADCETNSGTWTTPTYQHTSIISGLINDTGTADDDLWSAAKITSELAGKQATLGFTPENTANKGVVNGYAGLGSDGKVPLSQLPTLGTTYELPSLADAQAGASTTPYVWSPQRVAQAIAALAPSGSAGEGYYEIDGGSSASITFTGDIDGGASI